MWSFDFLEDSLRFKFSFYLQFNLKNNFTTIYVSLTSILLMGSSYPPLQNPFLVRVKVSVLFCILQILYIPKIPCSSCYEYFVITKAKSSMLIRGKRQSVNFYATIEIGL